MSFVAISAANLTYRVVKDLISAHAKGKADEESRAREEKRLEELTINLWGSMLFEMRVNCERVRFMVEESNKVPPVIALATFDFAVSDAVIEEFAKIVPQPVILAVLNGINSSVRRIDFFQRRADPQSYVSGIGFARDAEGKGLYERFNEVRDLADSVGQACFEGWEAIRPGVLPPTIDSSKPIDHGLL